MKIFTAMLFGFAALTAACAPAGEAMAETRYEIDASHTHVQFSVQRFGFNDVIGAFGDVKGVIALDQDNPENSNVQVEIGVASLNSGDATRDEHLASPFWFNMEEFPTVTFKSTSVELIDDRTANVTGDLTLLGATQPITLRVVLNKIGQDPATKKEAAGFSATATLDRTAFGMETAANLIGNDVAIRIETLAHKVE